MASVQQKDEIVTVRSYRLDLSEEEAQFVVDVMARIGGDLVHSRRKYAEEISGRFDSLKLYSTGGEDISKSRRSLFFENVDS